MSLVAPVFGVLVDCEIVEIVCTLKTLDNGSQGIEFRRTDSPGSFVLQFLQPGSRLYLVGNCAIVFSARLFEEVPEWVSGGVAILPAERVEETRPRSWRNEEICGEEVGVFSTVTAPVYVVSHLLAYSRFMID